MIRPRAASPQEALHRELLLKQKMVILQELLATLLHASEKSWQVQAAGGFATGQGQTDHVTTVPWSSLFCVSVLHFGDATHAALFAKQSASFLALHFLCRAS